MEDFKYHWVSDFPTETLMNKLFLPIISYWYHFSSSFYKRDWTQPTKTCEQVNGEKCLILIWSLWVDQYALEMDLKSLLERTHSWCVHLTYECLFMDSDDIFIPIGNLELNCLVLWSLIFSDHRFLRSEFCIGITRWSQLLNECLLLNIHIPCNVWDEHHSYIDLHMNSFLPSDNSDNEIFLVWF